jgi:hypothetical protein
MSDHAANSPRPVPLIVTLCVLALSAAFFVVIWRFYKPVTVAPQNEAAENLPKDLEWKATPESRRAALATLREKQAKQAASYAWIDQKTGVVQLPIDRAMELVVQQYGSKK